MGPLVFSQLIASLRPERCSAAAAPDPPVPGFHLFHDGSSLRSTRSLVKRIHTSVIDGGDEPDSDAADPWRSWSTRGRRPTSSTLGKRYKLTEQDRMAICAYREQHPTLKQDDIALHFGVERSTVLKILKDRWRASGIKERLDAVPPLAISQE